MPFRRLFRPHRSLADEVNRNLVRSEIEGGVRVDDLPPGSLLRVTTQNTCYRILILFGTLALITGHPLFCPRPVLITIRGSTWGGTMLKMNFLGRGMRLEFQHPDYNTPIVTSPIQDIEECPQSMATQNAVSV
jgi:hypothetical protein